MRLQKKGNRLKKKTETAVTVPWLKRGLLACLLALFITGGYQIMGAYLLPINSLYVTGNIANMDRQDLKQTVKNQVNAGFFAVNVNQIKIAVQKLDWVQSVSVRRVWPDSLHLEITEHIPVARWRDEYFVNQRGALFLAEDLRGKSRGDSSAKSTDASNDNHIVASDLSSLPIISGPKDLFSQIFLHYMEIKSVVDEGELEIVKLVVDARRSMRVTLSNGIVLLLGRVAEESYDYQELARFVNAYNITLARRAMDIKEIDLRYTNGFAVQWKNSKFAQTNVLPVSNI